MAKLRCIDCGKEIEDEGADEDGEYVCAKCLETTKLEDGWIDIFSEGRRW